MKVSLLESSLEERRSMFIHIADNQMLSVKGWIMA
jgi:hypothetical protein